MTKVLVTGGSGRLGRSAVAGLAGAGCDVVSLDRESTPAGELPAGEAPGSIVQEAIDLLAPGEAKRAMARHAPDAVIHLAAIAVPFSAPEDVILSTNTRLAFAVMSAASEAGVSRIITASSPTVMGYGNPQGWLPARFPIDEGCARLPWNAYGLSKMFAEETMHMLAAANGDLIRYAAFRPCFVISPEEWRGAVTQQGHTVRERLDTPRLSAPALFNYVDARDVAEFLILLLEKMDSIPNAQTFFVGAADALAREPLAELIPEFVPGSAKLAAQLTGDSPAFSIEKAKQMLGWRPKRSWRTELAMEADDGAVAAGSFAQRSGRLAATGANQEETQ